LAHEKLAASASAQEVRPAVVAMHKEAIERGTLQMDEDVVAWGILMGELF
jgi:anti-sigma28 factor (negative regulator of flagellin synthesis)